MKAFVKLTACNLKAAKEKPFSMERAQAVAKVKLWGSMSNVGVRE
jgi:hypothetical protein